MIVFCVKIVLDLYKNDFSASQFDLKMKISKRETLLAPGAVGLVRVRGSVLPAVGRQGTL